MIRFIRELRRREVFRTVGLYVGVCWIAIEAASILLPVFEAPDWVLRGLVVIAIAGFPVVSILAWVFDVTSHGIEVQHDPTDTIVPRIGARRLDFVVIGVLAVALAFSIVLNVTGRPEVVVELEPVSVLVADFDNSTSESIFDGVLEQTVVIGIENAPHIVAYSRLAAEQLAPQLQPGEPPLNVDAARLVARQEGIGLLISGSIEPRGQGFRVELRGLNPESGEASFDVSDRAANRDAVLTTIGELANTVREELGDESPDRSDDTAAETFTAGSVEAARAYLDGARLAYDGRHQEAAERFRQSTELDPELGRAFAGWAISAFELGRQEEAADLWDRAQSLMATMTERERLRTLGLYDLNVTRNYEQAVERLSELLDRYPADVIGRHGLAIASFRTLDFETAAAESERVLEMFPNDRLYRASSALYAMYAGDFDSAEAEARAMIETDPDYGTPYIPLASSLLATGEFDAAGETYRRMAQTSTGDLHGESVAMLGLADVAIYRGALEEAEGLLSQGIAADLAADLAGSAAVKQIALAEVFAARGDNALAIAAANRALELSQRDSIRVAAALTLLDAGEIEAAGDLADMLSAQLNDHSRAYGLMIEGAIQRRNGELLTAIDTLRSAIEISDLWRIRYELGQAYVEGGFRVEAFDELRTCEQRRGEAAAMFLDDMPTFRYLAGLPAWLSRAQDALSGRQ